MIRMKSVIGALFLWAVINSAVNLNAATSWADLIEPDVVVDKTTGQAGTGTGTSTVGVSPKDVTHLATKVAFYAFPISLPNDALPEFATGRDNVMAGLVVGGPVNTRSRDNYPTGVEIRNIFDAGDVTTCLVSTNMWRSQLAPPTPFSTQLGNRGYCSVIVVGLDGKVRMDDLGYHAFAGLMSTNASLAGLGYGYSRIGVKAGPSGKLWANDALYVNSGAGSQLVDALVYIGAGLGMKVGNQAGLDAIRGYVGGGMDLVFQYEYATLGIPTVWQFHVPLVNSIPANKLGKAYGFPTPTGIIFSILNQINSHHNVYESGNAVGPWSLYKRRVSEGTSMFSPFFTGGNRNPNKFWRIDTLSE